MNDVSDIEIRDEGRKLADYHREGRLSDWPILSGKPLLECSINEIWASTEVRQRTILATLDRHGLNGECPSCSRKVVKDPAYGETLEAYEFEVLLFEELAKIAKTRTLRICDLITIGVLRLNFEKWVTAMYEHTSKWMAMGEGHVH